MRILASWPLATLLLGVAALMGINVATSQEHPQTKLTDSEAVYETPVASEAVPVPLVATSGFRQAPCKTSTCPADAHPPVQQAAAPSSGSHGVDAASFGWATAESVTWAAPAHIEFFEPSEPFNLSQDAYTFVQGKATQCAQTCCAAKSACKEKNCESAPKTTEYQVAAPAECCKAAAAKAKSCKAACDQAPCQSSSIATAVGEWLPQAMAIAVGHPVCSDSKTAQCAQACAESACKQADVAQACEEQVAGQFVWQGIGAPVTFAPRCPQVQATPCQELPLAAGAAIGGRAFVLTPDGPRALPVAQQPAAKPLCPMPSVAQLAQHPRVALAHHGGLHKDEAHHHDSHAHDHGHHHDQTIDIEVHAVQAEQDSPFAAFGEQAALVEHIALLHQRIGELQGEATMREQAIEMMAENAALSAKLQTVEQQHAMLGELVKKSAEIAELKALQKVQGIHAAYARQGAVTLPEPVDPNNPSVPSASWQQAQMQLQIENSQLRAQLQAIRAKLGAIAAPNQPAQANARPTLVY